MAAPELEAAQGAARAFWNRVRQRFIGTRYFCWAELQRRGQVHYHAVWLNPPSRKQVDLVHLVKAWWRLGRSHVRFAQPHRGDTDMLDYAMKYADKMGRKRYQQAYDQMPSSIRTFMSQRLEISPVELREHLDRDVYDYVPSRVYRGSLIDGYIELVARIQHLVYPPDRCCARLHRRGPPRPRTRWDRPPPAAERDRRSAAGVPRVARSSSALP